MRRNGIDDLRRLAVLAGELAAYQRVRSLDLVGQRFADVMEQSRPPRLLFVESQLRGHRAADERGFDRMHQDVLRIRVPVLEHPEQLDQFGVNPVDADLDNRALAGFANRFLDVLLGDRPALTPVESFYQRILAGIKLAAARGSRT